MVDAKLVAAPAPAASGVAFNVGSGEGVSLLDIIGRLDKLLGRALQRDHTPSRAGDVPHTLADIDKARRLMGYTQLVDFDEGCVARWISFGDSKVRALPTHRLDPSVGQLTTGQCVRYLTRRGSSCP